MTDTTTYVAAAEASGPSTDGSSKACWTFATLFAFRFVCAYCVLQWVPLIVQENTSPLTAGVLSNPNWWGAPTIAVGRWAILHVLGLPEHSPPRMSANNLPLFLGIVTVAVISAAIAVAWSTFDRRRVSHPQLFVWVHTFMRFMLAAILLGFGWGKVLPSQFDVSFDYFALQVGQHSPRDLLWAFMGASREYQVFTGLVEVGAGLLLLTRRTAIVGALASMAAMANVLALDISYDVPVKFLAGQIFLMTLFVLAPFAKRLVDVFVLNHETHPMPVRRLLRRSSADGRARVVGMIFGAWIAFGALQQARNWVSERADARQTPLYGIWDVEETRRNGVPIPLLLTDATLWRRLVVQFKNGAVIVPMSDSAPQPSNTGRPSAIRYSARLDTAAQTVQFTPFSFYGTTQRLTFAYALPDPDHLVLTSVETENSDPVVVRMRRFDPSTFKLLAWRRSWNW